jgi:hypothetical protein
VVTRDLSMESNRKEVEVAQYLCSQHMEIVRLHDSSEILLNPNMLLEVNVAQEVGACRESGIQSDLLGPIGPEGNIGVAKVCTEPNISSELVGLNRIVRPVSQVNRAIVDESTPLIISGDHVGKKMSPISKLESVGLT